MGFALVFFTNYDFLMGLPTYKNFNYMSPAIMWLISLDYNFNKHIILMGGVFFIP